MRPSPVVRRRVGAGALAVVVLILVWLLLSGGGESGDDPVPENPASATTTSARVEPPVGGGDEATDELVDSVLLVGFEGAVADAEITDQLADSAIGGVLIGPANWEGKGPGAELIDAIRRAGGESPPLIVTRQEGGPYRSLPDLPPAERQIEIGDRADPRVAERWGEETAKALAGVGVDLNLAPVADVATLDSPIADRSFSDDAGLAAEMTVAALRGCDAEAIACAVSHFPGLGAGTQDTDQGPSSIGLDGGTLRGRDLAPFIAAFDAGVPAVVVSHGLYVAFDPVTPASLSRAVTTDLLRDELGFEGVAISDDLSAGAIAASTPPGPAAVAAVDAGIDLVQVSDPGDVREVRAALVAAVVDGSLSEDRLAEAAARVEALRP